MLLVVAASSAGEDRVPDQLFAIIYNNTSVDLEIDVDPLTRTSISLDPGQQTRIAVSARQWINFGMIANEFVIPDALWMKSMATIQLQAENDGNLYYVPSNQVLPQTPPPRQPVGFPLKPVNATDLT